MDALAASVTVTALDALMTTSSPGPGTALVLQSDAVVHAPLVALFQETVLGCTRSSSASRRGLSLVFTARGL
jgi:hypothetical protein